MRSCTTRLSRSSKASWRGLRHLLDQSETGDTLKIKVMNCHQERSAAGPAARARVRSERTLQEGLRRGVRRLRRSAFRRADRRLRVRQAPRRHRTPGEDFATLPRPRTRPFLSGSCAGHVQSGQFHRTGRAPRSGESFRHDGICQVEVIPAERRFALCRPVPARKC